MCVTAVPDVLVHVPNAYDVHGIVDTCLHRWSTVVLLAFDNVVWHAMANNTMSGIKRALYQVVHYVYFVLLLLEDKEQYF